jgi:type IX secretion system PorP/SprF family membrane protein
MRKWILHIALFLIYQTAFGQTNLFQFNAYKPLLNPAASAEFENVNFASLGNFRWLEVEGAPTNYAFNINGAVKENTFLGFQLNQTNVGLSSFTQLDFAITQSFQISETKKVAFSLAPGFSFNGSRLTEANLVDASDVEFSANQPLFVLPLARFGAQLYSEKFYLGLAIPNLIESTVFFEKGFDKRNSLSPDFWDLLITAGWNKEMGKNFQLDLANQTKLFPNSVASTELLVSIKAFNRITLGATYSSQNTSSWFGQIYMAENIFFGYGYNQNFAPILTSLPSHEVMLVFKGRN